jgi:Protein of unknown function (DUF2393)
MAEPEANDGSEQPEISLLKEKPPDQQRPWAIFAVVAVVLAAIIAMFIMATRGPSRHPRSAAPPYAQQLTLTGPRLSQAQNFVGATVTYIDGSVANAGDKTVTAASVEASFHNSLGQIVQQEEQPLRILRRSGAYPEPLDLMTAPLAPHQTREFRLTFEHISSDWNQQLPELRITDVTTQ